MYATIANPSAMLERAGRKYGAAFRIRLPVGPKLTYFTQYDGFRSVVGLRSSQAGMGGVLAQIPAISTWFPGTRRDDDSLERLAVTARSIVAHLVAPARVRAADFVSLASRVTASGSAGWRDTVDLSSDLHPIVYESALRFLLGEEIWAEFGSELVRLYREIVDSADVRRLALSRTPIHYLLPEYRAARRLKRLIPLLLDPRFASCSPAITEMNRQLAGAEKDDDARAWILMFLIWNAVSYTGSYAIWTLIDVLSEPALQQRVAASSGSERVEILSRCLWETIRRHPLAIMTRKAKETLACPVGDHTYEVPGGEYVGVLITPMTSDPQRFPEPARYDPDRYLNTPPPSDLLFGRGAFGCVAQEFSRILISTTLSELFARFVMTLNGPVPDRTCRVHLTYPTVPVHVRVHRHDD